jgi:hypothetical protein
MRGAHQFEVARFSDLILARSTGPETKAVFQLERLAGFCPGAAALSLPSAALR